MTQDDRARMIAAFHAAVNACDPAQRVADALARMPILTAGGRPPRAIVGVAIGKAALAMARGVERAGVAIDRGVVVSPVAGELAGWGVRVAAHPEPDDRSVEAARAVRALVGSATADDVVLALISGGASALIEEPRITLADFVATVRAVMAAGAPIDKLNTVRAALSAIKAGKLVEACPARVVTLVASDVTGDRLEVIGSGPTIGPWLDGEADAGALDEDRRRRAVAILEACGVAVPEVLQAAIGPRVVARDDRAELVLPMRAFAEALGAELALPVLETPMTGEVDDVADRLAGGAGVAWGEPTLHVPADHGRGGRAQQLALALARRLRGSARSALVAGTDGIDGPGPDAPAGAVVDGGTWDAIVAAGIDPARALARRDAGTALAAVGALVVTGPTGVNHADVAVVL